MARKTRKRRGRKVKRTRVRERLGKTRGRISRKRARRGGVLTPAELAAAERAERAKQAERAKLATANEVAYLIEQGRLQAERDTNNSSMSRYGEGS